MDWDDLAATFDLGALIEEPAVAAAGWGNHNRVWRVAATKGVFAVKEARRPLGDNIAAAIEIELAAVAGGVPAPEPVVAIDGRWVVRTDDASFRCHEWVNGRAKQNEEADPTDACAMGQLVARLHGLVLPAAPPEPPSRFGADHWVRLAAAAPNRPPWASLIRAHLEDIVATEAAMPNAQESCVGSHRDLNAHNVLFDHERLVLIDWDAAGPASPASERAAFALTWAHTDSGRLDLETATAFLRGYLEGGGTVDGSEPRALEGRLSGLVWWTEQNVQLALRGVGEQQDELTTLLVAAVVDGRRVLAEHQQFLAEVIARL